LPSRAQALIDACNTRPDFVYEEQFTIVYVDGPHHEYPDRQQRDREQQTCLEDAGYTVLRFGERAAWDGLFASHPGVFGHGRSA
jgi:very-short-patch-repair endonuclease